MSPDWLMEAAVQGGLLILAVSFLLCVMRLVRGPTLPDRVVALDLLAVNVVGFCCVFSVDAGNTVFMDVAIVLALVQFLGTVAFARYLEKAARRRRL